MQDREEESLGPLLYRCEQYPQKKWAIEANGGWPLVIFSFLAGPLVVGAGAALGIVQLAQLAGVDKQSMIGLPFVLIAVCCVLALEVACFWWYRRGVRKYGAQSIEAFEQGIRIVGIRNSVAKPYSEISNIYFGVKGKIAKEFIDINGFFGGTAGKAGSTMMNARLTVEFADGSKMRIINCRLIFKKQSIRTWLDTLKTIRPEIFAK